MLDSDINVQDYDGQFVRLSKQRIKNIFERNPDLQGHLEELKNVIRSPDIITEDDAGLCHLSKFAERSQSDRYLEVIIQYSRKDPTSIEGEVQIAFFALLPPRGRVIWKRKN